MVSLDEIGIVLLFSALSSVAMYAAKFYADRRARLKQRELALRELKALCADGRLTVAVKQPQEARHPRSGYDSGLYDWQPDPPEVKQ